MLSYQHIYHAGNFADVQKHALLIQTLDALKRHAPRIWLLDTHAGRGLYDLKAPEAQRKKEFMNGAAALLDDPPAPLKPWAERVAAHNPGGGLRFYPGTAQIARDILRPGDKMTLAELHPGEYAALEKSFRGTPQATLRKSDGLAELAQTPPGGFRGIAVVDPSYEIKTDYADVPRHLSRAWRKWPQGVFFLWYPLLTGEPHRALLAALRDSGMADILVSEIRLERVPTQGFALYGSGIAVINPPQPEAALREVTTALAARLPARAEGEVFWLDNRAAGT